MNTLDKNDASLAYVCMADIAALFNYGEETGEIEDIEVALLECLRQQKREDTKDQNVELTNLEIEEFRFLFIVQLRHFSITKEGGRKL